MPLGMVLAICKGECMKCHEQERWLYQHRTKVICDECLLEADQEEEANKSLALPVRGREE